MAESVIQVTFNILIAASLYSLGAISFSYIYYPSKFFHLAHAATITLGGYLVLFFTTKLSIPFSFSILLAIAIATGIGMLCETFVYHPMRKRSAPTLSYLVASIGLYLVLQNCISLYFGEDTKIINLADIEVGHEFFGANITTVQLLTIGISIILIIAAYLFLHSTLTGKSIRAVASNPELCNIYGISSNKIILIAFGIGSALAAIVGILSAMDTNMTPTFGFKLMLYGVVAMIIGGVGSTRGLIVGSLLVAIIQHLVAYYIDTKWLDAMTYLILILFLLWKPLGFSGKRLKKVEI